MGDKTIYTVEFKSVEARIALLDHQAISLSKLRVVEPNWLFYFRGGLQGVASRIRGAKLHYDALHSWLPPRLVFYDWDYHLSTTLFHMDSALECFVFTFNALGCFIDEAQFLDIRTSKGLSKIRIENLLEGRHAVDGWSIHFGEIQAFWRSKQGLIKAVMENHDVTKHRHAGHGNGAARKDAPAGFWDGIEEPMKAYMSPIAETTLGPDLKKPLGERTSDPEGVQFTTLESIMGEYEPFIEESLALGLICLECVHLAEERRSSFL